MSFSITKKDNNHLDILKRKIRERSPVIKTASAELKARDIHRMNDRPHSGERVKDKDIAAGMLVPSMFSIAAMADSETRPENRVQEWSIRGNRWVTMPRISRLVTCGFSWIHTWIRSKTSLSVIFPAFMASPVLVSDHTEFYTLLSGHRKSTAAITYTFILYQGDQYVWAIFSVTDP